MARAHFGMQIHVPFLPRGETKHQQPRFKNHRVFLGWAVQKLSYRKLGCQPGMEQNYSSSKHPDLQLRAPRLLGDVKMPPISPSPASQSSNNWDLQPEMRFFQFSIPGKVVFVRCLGEVMLSSKGLQLLLDVL